MHRELIIQEDSGASKVSQTFQPEHGSEVMTFLSLFLKREMLQFFKESEEMDDETVRLVVLHMEYILSLTSISFSPPPYHVALHTGPEPGPGVMAGAAGGEVVWVLRRLHQGLSRLSYDWLCADGGP